MKALYIFFIILIIKPSFSSDLIYMEPGSNSEYVNINSGIIFGFNSPVNTDAEQIKNNAKVNGSKSGIHLFDAVIADFGKKIILKPVNPFAYDEKVTVELPGRIFNSGIPADINTVFFTSKKKAVYNLCQFSDDGVYSEPVSTAMAPEFTITVNNNPSPGYFFTAPWNAFTSLMVLDNSAAVYWNADLSSMGGDFKKQINGLYSYFSSVNSTHYVLNHNFQVINNYTCIGYDADIHDFLILDNGNVLLMAYDPQTVDMSEIVNGGHPDATVIGLVIQELDQNRNLVFQWRSWDHMQITDATHENMLDSVIDYVHGNAFEIDYDNNILLSSRHLDEITKINHTTGNIIWRLGGKNNDFTFINDTLKFSHQHDIRRLANGNITLFDNGNYHPVPRTRIVEYKLDETNKTAELVWQYRRTPAIFSSWGGNAQRLPNGNTVIGWGGANIAISEVTQAGTVAFEGRFPANIYSYRSFKFDLTLTSVGGNQNTPSGFQLEQNYPNPFNPVTKITYSIAETGFTMLHIYDISGKMIKQLENGIQNAGSHTVEFDARAYSSGVYFYTLSSGGYSVTKKMILLK